MSKLSDARREWLINNHPERFSNSAHRANDAFIAGALWLLAQAKKICDEPTELVDAEGNSRFDEEWHQGRSMDAEDLTKDLESLCKDEVKDVEIE